MSPLERHAFHWRCPATVTPYLVPIGCSNSTSLRVTLIRDALLLQLQGLGVSATAAGLTEIDVTMMPADDDSFFFGSSDSVVETTGACSQ